MNNSELTEVKVTVEAYAVLQQWVRSGAVNISEAIIVVNDQIAPKAIEKWVVKTKVKP